MFDKNIKISQIQDSCKNTMVEHLGIEFLELGKDYISARMPVDHRTHQPFGLLHGGASISLAETLGSVASSIIVDLKKYTCVGLEINANHVKSARNGFVTGRATPIHIGKKTHVWDIRITNELNELVSVCRLTVVVLERKVS